MLALKMFMYDRSLQSLVLYGRTLLWGIDVVKKNRGTVARLYHRLTIQTMGDNATVLQVCSSQVEWKIAFLIRSSGWWNNNGASSRQRCSDISRINTADLKKQIQKVKNLYKSYYQ